MILDNVIIFNHEHQHFYYGIRLYELRTKGLTLTGIKETLQELNIKNTCTQKYF